MSNNRKYDYCSLLHRDFKWVKKNSIRRFNFMIELRAVQLQAKGLGHNYLKIPFLEKQVLKAVRVLFSKNMLSSS